MTAPDRPAGLGACFARHSGVVASFDDHGGWGVVAGAGGAEWYFHCTRIADGSRAIPAGTTVTFEVSPGPTGLEAVGLLADPS
jgi:cold shock CspA family protein